MRIRGSSWHAMCVKPSVFEVRSSQPIVVSSRHWSCFWQMNEHQDYASEEANLPFLSSALRPRCFLLLLEPTFTTLCLVASSFVFWPGEGNLARKKTLFRGCKSSEPREFVPVNVLCGWNLFFFFIFQSFPFICKLPDLLCYFCLSIELRRPYFILRDDGRLRNSRHYYLLLWSCFRISSGVFLLYEDHYTLVYGLVQADFSALSSRLSYRTVFLLYIIQRWSTPDPARYSSTRKEPLSVVNAVGSHAFIERQVPSWQEEKRRRTMGTGGTTTGDNDDNHGERGC